VNWHLNYPEHRGPRGPGRARRPHPHAHEPRDARACGDVPEQCAHDGLVVSCRRARRPVAPAAGQAHQNDRGGASIVSPAMMASVRPQPCRSIRARAGAPSSKRPQRRGRPRRRRRSARKRESAEEMAPPPAIGAAKRRTPATNRRSRWPRARSGRSGTGPRLAASGGEREPAIELGQPVARPQPWRRIPEVVTATAQRARRGHSGRPAPSPPPWRRPQARAGRDGKWEIGSRRSARPGRAPR